MGAEAPEKLAGQSQAVFDGAQQPSAPLKTKNGVALIRTVCRPIESRVERGKKIVTYKEWSLYQIVDRKAYVKTKAIEGGTWGSISLGLVHLIPGYAIGIVSGNWLAALGLGVLMGVAGVIGGIFLGWIIGEHEARKDKKDFWKTRTYEVTEPA